MQIRYLGAATARIGAVAAFFMLVASLCGTMFTRAWAGEPSAPLAARPTPTLALHAPAGVPKGYVVTPFGFFHPSCVHAVGRGEVLLSDGRIERADGTALPVRACAYPAYAAKGARLALTGSKQGPALSVPVPAGALPTADGWLEASWFNEKAPFGGISANWLVPSAPSSDVGQVLYYFPGLEDYENVVTILQPVLGWNGFNDRAWTISSWNCCTSGNANYSSPEPVATGDTIAGTVSGAWAAGTVCSTWNIATVDKTNGRQSALKQTSSFGQTFDWAFAGVVEVYGVSACDQYSRNGFVDFTAVSLLDVRDQRIGRPGWQASGLLQDSAPACNYGVTIAPASASLTF
ncbi:hypothetical protein C0Z18_13730 [Trinickia dabaoshanensis]|uniref:Uncharacterized protein n=1 Tax=Trinickia dabaoshanensis TaxID=564714 RepID=A0A2N7VQG7_9BURK|nr:hypothetical protein [Trinickia dabaoshanensis]PMS19383.1 hypothetical protein C0Z18_13730 [Trinickia dabaoshanensis]